MPRSIDKVFCILVLLLEPSVPCALNAEELSQWHAQQGFRWAELDVSKKGKTGFTLLSPEQTGISFTNVLAEEEQWAKLRMIVELADEVWGR